MLERKTRIAPVDIETRPADLRETLEEQRKLWSAPLYPYLFAELTMIIAWQNASSRFNRAFRIPSQGFWKR